MRLARVIAFVVSAAVAPSLSAQSYASLPLRLDLTTSTGDVASGYTGMTPDRTFDPGQGRYYGWDAAATGFDSNLFDPDPIWAYYFPTQPPLVYGIYVLPWFGAQPEDDPFYVEQTDLYEDGHTLTGPVRRVFTAQLPPDTGKVLVRLLVGRPDHMSLWFPTPTFAFHEAHGVQVHVGEVLDFASDAGLVTTEDYPLDASYSGATYTLHDHEGLWTRTFATTNGYESGSLSGYREVWLVAELDGTESGHDTLELTLDVDDALLDGSNAPLVAGDVPSVGAIEVYPYAEPPALFDAEASPPRPFVNPAYPWVDVDDDDDDDHFAAALTALCDDDDPEAALDAIDLLQDPLAEAAARLWVAGWLSGSRPLGGFDGIEWEQLDAALCLLGGKNGCTAPGALPGWALRERHRAQQYRRALLHHRLRAYDHVTVGTGSSQVTVDNPYATLQGRLNAAAGERLWNDLSGQQLEAVVGNEHLEVSPLLFKAATYQGINYWRRRILQTGATTPLLEGFFDAALHYDLWRGFAALGLTGGADTSFASHDTLAVLDHMTFFDGSDTHTAPDYDELVQSGIVFKWGGEGASVVHGGDPTWWDPLLQPAADLFACSLPAIHDWARVQGRLQLAYEASHAWWAAHGHVDGQYGGGTGDDEEFLLQQVFAALPRRGSLPAVTAAMQAVSLHGLQQWEDSNHFFGDGNEAGAADVEHTAEFTSNPLWANLLVQRGEPWYLEYAMQSLALMDPSGSGLSPAPDVGVPWMADVTFPSGVATHTYPASDPNAAIEPRRFVSWNFDGEGVAHSSSVVPATGRGDVPLNGRAIMPAAHLVAYNGNPTAARLVREWAEWWLVVALDDGTLADDDPAFGTGQHKPRGVLPGIVHFDDATSELRYGYQVATDAGYGDWWTSAPAWNGAYGFEDQQVHNHFVYGALLERFLDPASDDPATTTVDERLVYLEPIWHVARLLAEHWRIERGIASPDLFPGETWDATTKATPGHPYWAADLLAKQSSTLRQVFLALPYFPQIPNQSGGQPFFDVNRDTIITWAKNTVKSKDLVPYATLVLNQGTPQEDKDHLEDGLVDGWNWTDAFFPLFTTMASGMDRVFMLSGSAGADYLAASTGGFLSHPPSHRVTFEPVPIGAAEDMAPVRLASFVLGPDPSDPDLFRVLLHNLETQPSGSSAGARTVRCRFWHLFEPGEYEWRLRAHDGSNDEIVSPGSPDDVFDITSRGGLVAFDLPYAADACGEAWILEVTRAADQSGFSDVTTFADPALTLQDVAIAYDGEELSFTLPVHNVGVDDVAAQDVDGVVYLWLGASPTGPFGPQPTLLQPSHALSLADPGSDGLPGTDTLQPRTDAFSLAPQDFSIAQDVWLLVVLAITTPAGADNFNTDNDVVYTIVPLPSS